MTGVRSPNPAHAALTLAQVSAAVTAARRERRPALEAIAEQGGLAGEALAEALAPLVGMQFVADEALAAMRPALNVIPLHDALKRGSVAAEDSDGALFVAVADPFDSALRDWAEGAVGRAFTWALVTREALDGYLAHLEASARAVESVLDPAADVTPAEKVEDISFRSIGGDESHVVRVVNSTILDAMKAGATDIHFEFGANGLQFKYRIDGVLVPGGTVPGRETGEQVISRIKVMAELDIAERRIPQDGRFRLGVNGREIDFRVSVMPSIFGEDAVIRILDKQSLLEAGMELTLDCLGFDVAAIAGIRRLAREPYGMLLVTGPTGSGKTTTLYAAISEINDGRDKIVTIEDPVEYQLRGVLQIPVNEKKGLTFARGLRSILRHDPDKILVGEIRDSETAEIAVQAALTGHLVFTTVHANNVFDVIGRFTHMGVDAYGFVSALNGIVAQRLVRVLCPHCTIEARPTPELLRESGLEARNDLRDFAFREGRGCERCRGTGFKGRRAIAEMLLLTDDVRELIVERAPPRRLKEAAAAHGTRLLRAAAVELVRTGVTSLDEINRVTLVA